MLESQIPITSLMLVYLNLSCARHGDPFGASAIGQSSQLPRPSVFRVLDLPVLLSPIPETGCYAKEVQFPRPSPALRHDQCGCPGYHCVPSRARIPMTDMEKCAIGAFWKSIDDAMGIVGS